MKTALALHCGLASGAAWRSVAEYLPDMPLLCPDLPGHGRAPDWNRAMDFQTQALALATQTVGRGSVDVVGHSFGACLALRLLADRPGIVRSLTLIEPVLFAAAERGAFERHWRDMSAFRKMIAIANRPGAARLFYATWGDGRSFDDLPIRMREAMAARIHLVPAMEPAIVRDVHGVLNRLPAAPPPVLVVTRTRPPEIVASIADGLVARLPKAGRAELGRTHMIPMEAPAALARMLERFWRW